MSSYVECIVEPWKWKVEGMAVELQVRKAAKPVQQFEPGETNFQPRAEAEAKSEPPKAKMIFP